MAELHADIEKENWYSSGQLNPGQVGWSVGNEGDWRSCSGMACVERIGNRGRQNSDHIRGGRVRIRSMVSTGVNAAGSSQVELTKSDPMQVGRVEEQTTNAGSRCTGFC